MANVLTKDEFVADLRDLLSETDAPETVSEAVVVSASAPSVVSEASGEELEKKAREKRKKKTKRLGSGRNPFKHKDKLGLGPRGHHHTKTGAWKCRCSKPYACVCRNGNKEKKIKIDRGYKKSYNAEFKKYRKQQVY